MKWLARLALAGALLGLSSAAAGQVIFEDHFNGDSLGPHWQIFHNPAVVQYTVANGRFTIDWVRPPLGSPGQFATVPVFVANFSPSAGDFEATIRLGWEGGEHRSLSVALLNTPNLRNLGQMSYLDGAQVVNGSLGGLPLVSTPAPPPGLHEWRIARYGDAAHFWLNHQHIGTLPVTDPAIDTIRLSISFQHPGQNFQPIYFESIVIVPSPMTATGLMFVGLFSTARRRRAPCQQAPGTHC